MHGVLREAGNVCTVYKLVKARVCGGIIALILCVAIQHRCDLFARDGLVRRKRCIAYAFHNIVFSRPVDRLDVPVLCQIAETGHSVGVRPAGEPPQNGDHLGTSRHNGRGEGGTGYALHQPVRDGILHSVIEPVAAGYVIKRIFPGWRYLFLFGGEDRLNGMIRFHIAEGIGGYHADAFAIYQNVYQLITVLRLEGKGFISAGGYLHGTGRGDAAAAV